MGGKRDMLSYETADTDWLMSVVDESKVVR